MKAPTDADDPFVADANQPGRLPDPFFVSFLESPLGHALVGSSGVGVFTLLLGKSRPELEADFRARFRTSVVDAQGPVPKGWQDDVHDLLEHPSRPHHLALDPFGTPFQLTVWRALAQIPAGQVRSYSEIAESIGNPKAVRAVGQACARNPIAIAIPCHRVVTTDVKLGKYAWGAETKATLLSLEGAPLAGRTRHSQLAWNL